MPANVAIASWPGRAMVTCLPVPSVSAPTTTGAEAVTVIEPVARSPVPISTVYVPAKLVVKSRLPPGRPTDVRG